MSALSIPCPNCNSKLKLPNRSLLGKTAKCPKCAHRFLLEDPDEVELSLAEPEPEEVPVGRAARVVQAAPAQPQSKRAKPQPAVRPQENADEFPSFAAPETQLPTDSGGSARLREMRRKRQKNLPLQIGIGGVIAVGLVGVLIAASYLGGSDTKPDSVAAPPPTRDVQFESQRDRLSRSGKQLAQAGPTSGEPITLQYIPAGTSAVIHLRPAELWANGSTAQEVRYCLGPLAAWGEQSLRELCLVDPSDIEEALISVMLGARADEPRYAVVVRLKAGMRRSDLIQLIGGERNDEFGRPVYMTAERAFSIADDVDQNNLPIIFAAAPVEYAEDLPRAFIAPGLAPTAIEALLESSDRSRHLTLLFQPSEMLVHRDKLVPESVYPLYDQIVDWFGSDIEAVRWSGHLANGDFFTELEARPMATASPKSTAELLNQRLSDLPQRVLDTVSAMSPAEVGSRKLIGRLPAMTAALAAAGVDGTLDRNVLIAARLPNRAAPNLALASLLAWDESRRTDFTQDVFTPTEQQPELPATVAGRLQLPVEIEFNRTPLQEAFAYLAEETKTTIEVDGEALKFAGYTKNMPQSMSLGKVPATKAIAQIVSQYDQMAIVIDEAGNKAIVTTLNDATGKGLKPTRFED
ncbi:hypothetical protein [Stratiformator vulcanicus]|uniref:Uncharacterized protein n=1 Tax=Stratiformator vulcanicus TaxID=2527980 RepID=A0A517R336_9PLAN|nr:hypothetical protein [Stratiformator vulcanicus]QDT38274.1 hypothetical protein Pan189_26640 [Stratiformator vulcanicus]